MVGADSYIPLLLRRWFQGWQRVWSRTGPALVQLCRRQSLSWAYATLSVGTHFSQVEYGTEVW